MPHEVPRKADLVRENELLALKMYGFEEVGVVDDDALELALILARQSANFYDAAAEMVCVIVRSKPFRSGNNGTAMLAADLIYALNRRRLQREASFAQMIEQASRGEIDVAGVSNWLRIYSYPLEAG